jgi:hypothetical protein
LLRKALNALVKGIEDLKHGLKAEEEVRKELKEKYRYTYVFKIGGPYPVDAIAIKQPEILFVEVKTGKAKLSDNEKAFRDFIYKMNSPRIRYKVFYKPGLKEKIMRFFKFT